MAERELLNDPRTLYQILGVEKDAMDKEIRTAYRRRAHSVHPDHNRDNPAALSEFYKLTEAKNILLNKTARQTYDKRGLAAALVVMNPSSAGMSSYGAALLAFSATERCLILFAITVFFSLIALTPVFISLRSDGSIDWDWWVTFVPLWVVEVLIVIVLLAFGWKYVFGCYRGDKEATPTPEEDDTMRDLPDPDKAIASLARLSLFLLLAFATLQVLIALQLDGTIDTSYFVVLAPWLLIEAVILVTRAASLKSTFAILEARSHQFFGVEAPPEGVTSSSGTKFFFFVIAQLQWPLARLVFAVLLALRLDGSFDASYWTVFTPIWAALGLWGLFLFFGYFGLTVTPTPQLPPEHQVKMMSTHAMEACATAVCCLAPLVAVAILAAEKAEDTTDSSLIFVFVPVLVLSFCCCFVTFCTFCLLTQQRFENFTGVHMGQSDQQGDAASTTSDTPFMSDHAAATDSVVADGGGPGASSGGDIETAYTDIGDID